MNLVKAQNILSNNRSLEEHSRRVAVVAFEAAKLLKLPAGDMAVGAYLHDIGKTLWPEELFNKYPLEATDYCLVQAHPVVGVNTAKGLYPDLSQNIQELTKISEKSHASKVAG